MGLAITVASFGTERLGILYSTIVDHYGAQYGALWDTRRDNVLLRSVIGAIPPWVSTISAR